MNGRRILRFSAAAFFGLFAVCSAESPVRAGGMRRPNTNGARAVGMSGAFAPIADDSSAIYHNPAGLAALKRSEIMLSLEVISIFTKFTPEGYPTEKSSGIPQVAPFVSGGARVKAGSNTNIGLGLAIYSSFAGGARFDQRPIHEGPVKSSMGLFEFAPAMAVEIDRKFLLGFSLRVGLGYLSMKMMCGSWFSCTTGNPPQVTTTLDTIFGVGFGYSLGVRVEPVRGFYLGAVYRSPINVNLKGDDALHTVVDMSVSMRFPFPQTVSLGLAYRFTPRWIMSAQVDWIDNSVYHELPLKIVGQGSDAVPTEMTNTALHFRDTYAVHLGTEYRPIKRFAVRGGMTFDRGAISDKYRTRAASDFNSLSFDLGFTVYLGRWRIEGAFDGLAGDVSNGFKKVKTPDDGMSPGTFHPGGFFSFHIAGVVTF